MEPGNTELFFARRNRQQLRLDQPAGELGASHPATPDALQEFRIQTRTYSAEFGTAAGAVVNATIKSGSNQFHGDAWEFLRNSVLDANDYFANQQGVKRGRFSQNQYGATIGGPVFKNKTFFLCRLSDFYQPEGSEHPVDRTNALDEDRKFHRISASVERFAG